MRTRSHIFSRPATFKYIGHSRHLLVNVNKTDRIFGLFKGPIVDPVGPRPGGAGAPTSAPQGNTGVIHLLILNILFPEVSKQAS